MRRSKEDTADTRRQAVVAAAELCRTKGWDNVSVGDVMKAVDRTVGAFYRHFPSRDALLQEACQHTFDDFRQNQAARYGAAPQSINELVLRYLATEHRDDIANGCPVPSLLSTAERQSDGIRKIFTESVRARRDKVSKLSGVRDPDAHLAAVAAMVGALALARSVDDETLSADLLNATARHLVKVLNLSV